MSIKNWLTLVRTEQGKTLLTSLISLIGISSAPLLMNACTGKAVELHNEGTYPANNYKLSEGHVVIVDYLTTAKFGGELQSQRL